MQRSCKLHRVEVLGNFSTVEEVKTAIQSVYVCTLPTFPIPSPLHFNVTDAPLCRKFATCGISTQLIQHIPIFEQLIKLILTAICLLPQVANLP